MIPLIDLKAQYHSIKKDIDRALLETLEAGHFVHGVHVEQFEKEFAKYIGTHYSIGVNSGTDALLIGIRALGYKPGDEIIIPANTFMATVTAIVENGLRPVFVDIQDDDYGIDLEDLQKKITSKTRAVIIVHLFGQPEKIDEIQDALNEADHHIDLIEDACQAHGAYYKGKRIGTFGTFAAFSFYPGKNLGAYGDGGAVTTSNPKIAGMIRLLHDHGQDAKYRHVIIGLNSRLDEMQAAVLRVKLKYLEQWNRTRIEIAAYYTQLIGEHAPYVKTPPTLPDRESVHNLFVVRVPQRDQLLQYLKRHDIQTRIPYPVPLHLQRATIGLGYKDGDMPITEACANDMLALPMFPELTAEQCRRIVGAISDFYSRP